MRRFGVLLLFGLVCVPRTAMACATCFGAADAPQTMAMNMAILTLMGAIGTVLGLLATFIVYLATREKTVVRKATEAKDIGPMETGRLVGVNANE